MSCREALKALLAETVSDEGKELLATLYALVGYMEYIKEVNPDLHNKAMDFSLETADIPGIKFSKESDNEDLQH
jgi:hypothetical protein